MIKRMHIIFFNETIYANYAINRQIIWNLYVAHATCGPKATKYTTIGSNIRTFLPNHLPHTLIRSHTHAY